MGSNGKGRRCGECGAVGVPVDETLCKPCRIGEEHGPEARLAYLRDLSRKGGEASKRKHRTGLRDDELPPLDGHEAAKSWLRIIARKFALGKIDAGLAAELRRVVWAFQDAHRKETEDEVVKEIRDRLGELEKRIGRGEPWQR